MPTAAKGAQAQAICPSRGGPTTKVHVPSDTLGRPAVVHLTPSNASDVRTTPAVLATAPGFIRRFITEARLPPGKSFDSYDLEAVPMISKAQVMAVAAGDAWLKTGANLLLFGRSLQEAPRG